MSIYLNYFIVSFLQRLLFLISDRFESGDIYLNGDCIVSNYDFFSDILETSRYRIVCSRILCSPENIHFLPQKELELPGGEVSSCKTKKLKKCMKLVWNSQRGGMEDFCGTTHFVVWWHVKLSANVEKNNIELS